MLNKQFVVTSLILCVVIGTFFILQTSHVFLISKVSCTVDQNQPCPDFVQAELNKNMGKPIFFVNMSDQLNKISGYLPSLHQFQFRQHLPNQMSVNFISASPRYAIKVSSISNYFIIDETGTVIDQQAQTSLPVINLPDEQYHTLTLRASLNEQLNQALLGMLAEIEKHQLQFSRITLLSPTDLELELTDHKVAQLSINNLALEVDKLAYIVANVNFSSIKQPVKQVDLRFRYPVLKT